MLIEHLYSWCENNTLSTADAVRRGLGSARLTSKIKNTLTDLCCEVMVGNLRFMLDNLAPPVPLSE